MTKPDWKDAPDFANYLAQDKFGDWYWYENKPEARSLVWMAIPHFALASVGKGSVPNWRDTLEERPVIRSSFDYEAMERTLSQ